MDTGALAGRRVLVVGASSGIGRAFAEAAHARGARVAVAARSADVLAEVAAGIDGHPVAGDTTDEADCARIAASAAGALGGLDAVFHTPAPGYKLTLERTTAADWDAQFRAVLLGAANLTRAVVPHMEPGAVAIYLSSTAARQVPYGMVPYAALKTALVTMLAGWQREHPDRRFVAATIGPTAGTRPRTQHAADPELSAEVRRRMIAGGMVHEEPMQAPDLAAFFTELLASLLVHPGMTVPEITILPSSPPTGP